jgi:hypothetical protein
MCWLGAPRFELEPEDYELFGIETINRSLGGVYVGVNKAVGKHHYEVFSDEGRDSRIGELMTTTLRAQTLAAGDFDIEWANNPGTFPWQIQRLQEFREWLVANGFDPEDRSLTIGHPQVGQVDLHRSFGTEDYRYIWAKLNTHLNVVAVRTSTAATEYPYTWQDADYVEQQIAALLILYFKNNKTFPIKNEYIREIMRRLVTSIKDYDLREVFQSIQACIHRYTYTYCICIYHLYLIYIPYNI